VHSSKVGQRALDKPEPMTPDSVLRIASLAHRRISFSRSFFGIIRAHAGMQLAAGTIDEGSCWVDLCYLAFDRDGDHSH